MQFTAGQPRVTDADKLPANHYLESATLAALSGTASASEDPLDAILGLLREVLGADHIYVGVNAVDYSGYPDCRPAFISAFETMANLATKAGVEGHKLHIHAPLIDLSKADIIRRGTALGVDYGLTVSCYQADDEGRACGLCDACRLRRAGFEAAGVADPTPYR